MPGVDGVVEAFQACSLCAGDYEDPDRGPRGRPDGPGSGCAVDQDEYENERPDELDGDADQIGQEREMNGDEFPA